MRPMHPNGLNWVAARPEGEASNNDGLKSSNEKLGGKLQWKYNEPVCEDRPPAATAETTLTSNHRCIA